MSDTERLIWLQKLGHVPADADWKDWELAGLATWWGKPLDPKEFWKGKVVWCDTLARSEAAIHGRSWPPIPYDDATLVRLYPTIVKAYPNDSPLSWGQPGLDSPRMSKGCASTSRERAFWIEFIRDQPKPPEDLQTAQERIAESILKMRSHADDPDPRLRTTGDQVARLYESQRREMIKLGYPIEAMADDACFWAYVLKGRRKYQDLLGALQSFNSPQAQLFLAGSLVPKEYMTESLTYEQMKAANAWKFAYLQRLRREKADESYINAYLQAWNLSAAEVFGGTNRP